MSQEYFQLPAQIYTSSDVTPEGDLYRHGGWFPLVAGMFLLGCGIRILDETTDLRRSVHGAFLIILLFPDIVQAGSDCATLLAGIPGKVLLWLAVIAASFRAGRGRRDRIGAAACQREGRLLVTGCRRGDREAGQPVTGRLAAVPRVGRRPGSARPRALRRRRPGRSRRRRARGRARSRRRR